MTTATINVSYDHSQYVEQVYDKHSARLKYYFLRQIGDVSEAEDCAQETLCRFFVFIGRRQWEKEVEYIPVYLMRIAGLLCLERLAEKKSQCADSVDEHERSSLPDKIRDDAIRSIKERLQLKQRLQKREESPGGNVFNGLTI
jgi:DNA-directed RNA polymerase specialized sigma24 family protein